MTIINKVIKPLTKCFLFAFFLCSLPSFSMEKPEEKFPLILDLRNQEFECEDTNLKDHLIKINKEWASITINKSNQKNYLLAGLYAFNTKEKKWFFFTNKNIYLSGWFDKIENINNHKPFFLGSIYGFKNKIKKYEYGPDGKYSNEVTSLVMPEDSKDTVIQDLKNRGLLNTKKAEVETPKDKIFNYQAYAHSEQAFLANIEYRETKFSDHQDLRDHEEITDFSAIVLLFSSTNPPCDTCAKALLNCLHSQEYDLRKKVLNYFLYSVPTPEKITTNYTPKNANINIFYSYAIEDSKIANKLDLSKKNLYILSTN